MPPTTAMTTEGLLAKAMVSAVVVLHKLMTGEIRVGKSDLACV